LMKLDRQCRPVPANAPEPGDIVRGERPLAVPGDGGKMPPQSLVEFLTAVFAEMESVEGLILDPDARVEELTVGSGHHEESTRTQDATGFSQERMVILNVLDGLE